MEMDFPSPYFFKELKMRIKIESDVFDICNRIKQIDEGYFVMYNLSSKKFEIHNKNVKNTYCLTIPYKNLDVRVIDLIHKTSIKNYDSIVKVLETENDKIEIKNFEKEKEKSEYKIREILKYSKSDKENIKDAFKTNWA